MSTIPDRVLLHLAVDSNSASVVEETLRRLGREESVIGMRDFLAAGPLEDIDSGGLARTAWWKRILEHLHLDGARGMDDSDLWHRVRADEAPVVLWHGPNARERLFVLRACWHLRDQTSRVHEVALPPGPSRSLPAFYAAVGIAGPNVTTSEWHRLSPVAEVQERAKRWEDLKSHPGAWIRFLEDDDVVERPITAFDDPLVKACSPDGWTRSLNVVGRVLAENWTSYSLLVWRIRELVLAGMLDARGVEERDGLPGEVRPTPSR